MPNYVELHTLGSAYLDESDHGAEDEQADWSDEDADKGGGTAQETSSLKHSPVSIYHPLHRLFSGAAQHKLLSEPLFSTFSL